MPISELGTERFYAIGGLLLVVAPYNVVVERQTRSSGNLPAYVLYVDQLLGIGVMAAAPDLWAPALVVMATSLALGAAAHDLRRVAVPAALSVLGVAVVGWLTQDVTDALIGTIGFAGGATLAVVPTALVSAHRDSLQRENRDLVENTDAIVWVIDQGSSRYSSMSSAAERLLGFPRVNLLDVEFWLSHVHPDDRDRVVEVREQAVTTGSRRDVDYRVRSGDGSWRWFREVLSATPASNVDRPQLRGITVDITARRTAEEERQLYGELVEHIQTALLVAQLDPGEGAELVVVAANPAAARLFGTVPGRMTGNALTELITPLDAELVERARGVAVAGGDFTVERIEGLGIDRQKTFSLQAFGLPGRAVGFAISDVTESAMVAAALRRQALHDGLTGLPNRTLLRDRLQYALSDAKRRKEMVALIILDLNHFKDVNDAFGHQYGDRLLVAFAKRLQHLLRECDTIARLGGDEFALLLTHASSDGADRVVRKVTEAMQEPFELDGVSIQGAASLGVAMYPDHAEDADLLTQRADVAMYAAKRGTQNWQVYTPADDQSSLEKLTLLAELHTELDDHEPREITLHYQPIYDLADDSICGAEALLRWNHTSMGWINPERVVELAELSGLINPLARFVVRRALTVAADWESHGRDLSVAINLSARNLYDRNLVAWIDETLQSMQMPPQLLKCELTESQVMDDPVLAMEVISRLGEIGVRTAIDDFGTGYSSLAYLRRLPVDEIKIDKSFVMSMLADRNDMTIVRTVIDLAHNLGMSVLAEGVEDDETLETLRQFGCDKIQGYVIGRPMPPDDFARLLHDPSRPSVDR